MIHLDDDSVAVCEDLDAGRTLCSVITSSDPGRSFAMHDDVCESGGYAEAMTLCAGANGHVLAYRGGRAEDGLGQLRTARSHHSHGKGM